MDLGVAAGWGTRDPEHLVSLAQQSERLKDALQRLEGSEREVLLLRDVQQLSGKETAQALGLPIAAMKSRLHRARLRLAVELRKGKDAR
ncbi:MAG: sigma factor-like helix-turn-helix DNA-binding protein, partial [Myxococcota bacterium]